jgi:LPXTG-motif cell wall-anchored protein
VGPAHHGDELWITSQSPGYFSLYAKVEGVKTKVRYFKSNEYPAKQDLQDCFFAVVTAKEKKVGVMVDFHTPPSTSTPPTSETPSTSTPETSVPVTPETTVVDTTVPDDTTTVPVTPSQGGGLPVTGAQSVLLTALALALIGVGAAFGIVSRRRRGES